MFTIPATTLGTRFPVHIDASIQPNNRVCSLDATPPTYVQMPYPIFTVNELETWFIGWAGASADTVYLPTAEYAAVKADWSRISTHPASAFKVGDYVVWSSTSGSSQYGALVAGQTYYVISCAWPGPPPCWALSLTRGGNMVDVADEDELTIVIQPTSSGRLPPFSAAAVIGYPETSKPFVKRCECGAAKCKSNIHSEWCPMWTPRCGE
jgi:hypothetical protein